MKEKFRKTCILALATLLMLSMYVSAGGPKAGIPTPDYIAGTATIGGTAAPAGTSVKALISSTDEIVGSATVTGGSGAFELQIEFCDPDVVAACTEANATDGKATLNTNIKFKVANDVANVTGHTGKTSSAGGGYTTGVALAIAAGCGDGIPNGAETGVDCGGTCTACYAMTISPSTLSLDVPANSSGTTKLTITNTGKNNLAGVTVAVPAFSPTQGSITVNATLPATTIQGSGTGTAAGTKNINVTINVAVVVNTTENIYSGAINVSATNVTTQQATLVINTVTAGELVKRSKRIDLTVTGLEGAPICLGAPVVVKAIDERTDKPLDKADVDVYRGEKLVKNKVFYGETDANGEYKFTPKEAGDYIITVSKTGGYREAELKVTVKTCVAETTTVPVTTTITAPVVTTTTPKYTTSSTVPATTTITAPKVTTTVYKPPVTTKPVTPPVPPKKGISWGIIIVVVIVVIAAVLYMQSKGKKAAPAAEEPKKEEKKK